LCFIFQGSRLRVPELDFVAFGVHDPAKLAVVVLLDFTNDLDAFFSEGLQEGLKVELRGHKPFRDRLKVLESQRGQPTLVAAARILSPVDHKKKKTTRGQKVVLALFLVGGPELALSFTASPIQPDDSSLSLPPCRLKQPERTGRPHRHSDGKR
jgi:hypothetical protein